MNSIQYNIWISSVNKFHVSWVTNLKTLHWCLPCWLPHAHTHTHPPPHTQVHTYRWMGLPKWQLLWHQQCREELSWGQVMECWEPTFPEERYIVNWTRGEVLLFHTYIILQLSLCAVHTYKCQDEKKLVWLNLFFTILNLLLEVVIFFFYFF